MARVIRSGDRDSIDGNNLYAYAANDPVNYTDPSGLNPVGLIYSAESAALNYATQHGFRSCPARSVPFGGAATLRALFRS
nr:hypothetical protein [Deltaproteobacteria bacterium]